jgi:hypothetical protein
MHAPPTALRHDLWCSRSYLVPFLPAFRLLLHTQTADVERQLQEAADAEAFQFKVSFTFKLSMQ